MSDRRVIWITGASSGIGAALARAWAGQGGGAGVALILSGRRREALAAVAAACGDVPVLVLPFEATDYDALPGLVAQAHGWRGRIDVLVNNAGISQRSRALETEFAVYRQLMEVDFFAPLRLTQLVLPLMVAQGGGHLVQIASVAGKVGAPLRTGYCAAKHALVGYSDALRAELAGQRIKVTVVTPGFIRTGIAANALTGAGTVRGQSDDNIEAGMDPAAAAAIIVRAVRQGREEAAMGGAKEMLALWLKRLAPRLLSRQMQAMGAQAVRR